MRIVFVFFFFSSRRRHTRFDCDWSSDVCSSDLFTESLCGQLYGTGGETDVSFRVIADHARAIAFMVADGVRPSNEGRGYVLRRILRRAARHGKNLGLEGPFLARVAGAVIEEMGGAYPELRSRRRDIEEGVTAE